MPDKSLYKVDKRKRPEWMPAMSSIEGLTHGRMSRDAKQALWLACVKLRLDEYFEWLAIHHPPLFVDALCRMTMKDDGSAVGGLTITVQQVNVAPQPTPGVLASVVEGYVAPQRALEASNG